MTRWQHIKAHLRAHRNRHVEMLKGLWYFGAPLFLVMGIVVLSARFWVWAVGW